MPSTKDWFAKKLGQNPPVQMRQQPQPVNTPPTSPIPQFQPQPVNQSQPIVARNGLLDPNADPNAKYSVGDAIQVWGGNQKGGLTENMLCPNCAAKNCTECNGGRKLFQRKNGMKRGYPPAPLCDCCGFNGLFEQFGATEG